MSPWPRAYPPTSGTNSEDFGPYRHVSGQAQTEGATVPMPSRTSEVKETV